MSVVIGCLSPQSTLLINVWRPLRYDFFQKDSESNARPGSFVTPGFSGRRGAESGARSACHPVPAR